MQNRLNNGNSLKTNSKILTNKINELLFGKNGIIKKDKAVNQSEIEYGNFRPNLSVVN